MNHDADDLQITEPRQQLLFDNKPEDTSLGQDDITILAPQDVMDTLERIREPVTATILDPWYNRGKGGVRSDYYEWLFALMEATAKVSDHIFLWGFPEIVYKALDHLPPDFALGQRAGSA